MAGLPRLVAENRGKKESEESWASWLSPPPSEQNQTFINSKKGEGMNQKAREKLEEVEVSPYQEVREKVQEKIVPVDPVFINAPTGTVAIFGHEQVSKKMLKMIGTALSHDAFEIVYHGIKSIVFRVDGYPKSEERGLCSNFAPDTGGISINMDMTLEKALERSMDHPDTSLLASWWLEMLLNIGHELHHAVSWDTDRNKLHNNNEAQEEEEKKAEDYSSELINTLAQNYDVEPPRIEEEVWFNKQIIELFSGKEEDGWTKTQTDMIDNGYMWKHEPEDGEPIILHSFKDFVCLISNGDETAEEWNKEVITLPDGLKSLDEQLNGKKVILESTTDSTPVQAEIPIPTTEQTNAVHTDEYNDDVYDAVYEENPYSQASAPNIGPISPISPQSMPQPTTESSNVQNAQHDAETISRIAKQVYMKMFDFIFKNCVPKLNSDLGFQNPEIICTNPIPLTEEEKSVFVSMNHLDSNGRWCTDIPTTNGLLGKVMKNTRLPSYEVYLNVNNQLHKRLFIPQNPAKCNATGQLTQRAAEARAGNAIAYVIIPSEGARTQYGPSIINGQYKIPHLYPS